MTLPPPDEEPSLYFALLNKLSKKNMLKYNSAYHGGEGKIDYFPLTPLSCLDIDYEEDFQLVEKIIIANTNKRYKAKFFK